MTLSHLQPSIDAGKNQFHERTRPANRALRRSRGRSSCEGPLTDRVLGFQAEFAKAAMPFDWTFTRSELHACSIASIRAAGSRRPP
jgi:hypothetical protein